MAENMTGSGLENSEFSALQNLLKSVSGIDLGDDKQPLVRSRLASRMRSVGASGIPAYVSWLQTLQQHELSAEIETIVDAVSTNVTSFFREQAHFDFLCQRILPEHGRGGEPGKRLRIWSSACSTGEEPYSMAMTLFDAIPDIRTWDIRILATDISRDALATAKGGIYPEEKLGEIAPERQRKHFERARVEGKTAAIQVKQHLRALIKFTRLNLMGPWPMKGPFDLIFCRNVMIYFDRQTQQELATRFHALLRPGGHLMIGHSENLGGGSHGLELAAPTIYRRP